VGAATFVAPSPGSLLPLVSLPFHAFLLPGLSIYVLVWVFVRVGCGKVGENRLISGVREV
jgi:hypothetical protein